MANKNIKTGKVNVPAEDFEDMNITAHISIRLPLHLVKNLKRIALTEEYEGRYQTLIRDVLDDFVKKNKGKSRKTA